jgi:hypothetical protein
VNALKIQYPNDLLNLRNGVDSTINMMQMSISQVKQQPVPESPVVAKVFPEPPYYYHIYFSGSITKTHCFCCVVQDTFARLAGHFSSKKQKILWIASYFHTASGHLGDNCLSYTWWRGLLTKNAHKQDLPVCKALSAADFVIDELASAEFFLSTIEEVFSNHKEHEEAQKSLLNLQQGNNSIAEFNIQINTLFYTVFLSEESKCEVYESAINPKIVELGINCGGCLNLILY